MRTALIRLSLLAGLSAAGVLIGGVAHASITAPANGGTVAGTVSITEASGGCADTRIEIDDAAGRLVTSATKGFGGAFTFPWSSFGNARGQYTLKSQAAGFFIFNSCINFGFFDISSINVSLQNGSIVQVGAPSSAFSGDTVLVTAHVSSGSFNLGARTVTFSMPGGLGPVYADTDKFGIATASLPVSTLPGARSIQASWNGDDFYMGASTLAPITVNARPTSIAYTGPTSSVWNATVILSAVLTDVPTSGKVADKPVRFTVKSGPTTVATLDAVTDSVGSATAGWSIDVAPGPYTITAAFLGDPYTSASSVSPAFTVLPRGTVLALTGPGSIKRGQASVVTGRVTDLLTGDGIGGRTVNITITGGSGPVWTGSLVTDGAGGFVLSLPDLPAGGYTVSATAPADVRYLGSAASARFTILDRAALLTYTGPGQAFLGQQVTLGARLEDDTTLAPIPGANVTWTLLSNNQPVLAVTGVTDARGLASAPMTFAVAPGPYVMEATFSGNADYVGAAVTRDFVVLWEYTFTDMLGNGVVHLNPSTLQYQVETPAATSAITMSPGMLLLGPLVVIPDTGDPLLVGAFDRATKVFAAVTTVGATPALANVIPTVPTL